MTTTVFRKTVYGVMAAAILMAGGFLHSVAHAQSVREFEVKAALIYNFAQFVTWPDQAFSGPNAPFRICVLTDNPSTNVMERTFRGKSVRGRPIQIEQSGDIQGVMKCHILFVGQTMKDRMPEIMRAVGSREILTIGDMDRFAESGGIIGLYEENNKMRFEVNLGAARRAHLAISSKMLKAGKIVGNN
jgi:hypothetical protein